jgi:hypothetical protein
MSDIWLFHDRFLTDEGIAEGSDRFSSLTDVSGIPPGGGAAKNLLILECQDWWRFTAQEFGAPGQWTLTDQEPIDGRAIYILQRNNHNPIINSPEQARLDLLLTTQDEWG